MEAKTETVCLLKRRRARHVLFHRRGDIDIVGAAPVPALDHSPIHPHQTGQTLKSYTPITLVYRSRKPSSRAKHPHLHFHLSLPIQFNTHKKFPNSTPRPGHAGCPFHLPILNFSRSTTSTPWGIPDLGRHHPPQTLTSINKAASTHYSKDTLRPRRHGVCSRFLNAEEGIVGMGIKGHQLCLSSYSTKIAIKHLMTMGDLKGEIPAPERGGKPSVHIVQISFNAGCIYTKSTIF